MSEPRVIECSGVLFDMDGVLVSSIGSVNRCWRRWAEHYGVPNPDAIEIPHGTRAIDIMARLAPDVDPVEGLQLIEDMEIEDIEDLKVLRGVAGAAAQPAARNAGRLSPRRRAGC